MKNFILSASLLATTILFANTIEKTEATTISKKKKVKLSKQQIKRSISGK